MNRGDILVFVFLAILAAGFIYLYINLDSFDCYMERSVGNVMSDIEYEFEPNGSIYGKTAIYRFTITSEISRLEYFGMSIKNGEEQIFFENRTVPQGGSIVASVNLSEYDNITISRFFKKTCYEEVRL